MPRSQQRPAPVVLTARPNLDEHDLKTVREIYAQVQNWTRHYETLVVSTNVLLVSASMIFVGLALREAQAGQVVFLLVPLFMSLVGIVLTRTLFGLYALCIERLIRIENLLNCYDSSKFDAIDGGGSLLPSSLMTLPVRWPTTVRLFFGLHGALILVYAWVLVCREGLVI